MSETYCKYVLHLEMHIGTMKRLPVDSLESMVRCVLQVLLSSGWDFSASISGDVLEYLDRFAMNP